jgi:hypothetical protein
MKDDKEKPDQGNPEPPQPEKPLPDIDDTMHKGNPGGKTR